MGVWEFLMGVVILGFIGLAGLVALIIWGVRKAARSIKGGHSLELPEYQYLDEDAGASAAEITGLLKQYTRADGVNTRARKALAQVDSANRKRENLRALISGKFTEGSLSWDKFVAAIDAAYNVLLRNLTQLTNRVQTFDAEDYRVQKRERSGVAYRRDGISDTVQDERWEAMEASLAEMDQILTANERLLLDLDKFALEFSKLDQEGSSENRVDAMLEEIQQLTEELKYYQQ